MKHLFLLSFCLLLGRQGFSQENFSVFRAKYNFEREVYAGNTSSEPKRIELPFDTLVQKADFTKDLNAMLDYVPPKVRYTHEIEKRKFEGWRIQIYRGRSREEANNAKKKSYEMFPNLTAYLEYNAPTYRVKVGDFLDPSEFQSILRRFKRIYPTAISVPAIITLIIDNRERIEEEEKERLKEKEKKDEKKD
jgi:hypothetical protein